MSKALVVGSLNMDITTKVDNLPKLGETIFGHSFYKSCGGKGANQAVAISKLGMETEILGMVGRDSDGKELIQNLEKYSVKSRVLESDTPTGRAIITVDKNGDNNIIVIPGSNLDLNKNDIDNNINVIEGSDVVVFQNEIKLETIEYALLRSKELNKITVFNPAPATKLNKSIFENTDYLVVNETELEVVFEVSINEMNFEEKIMDIKRKNNISNIILTMGDKGAYLFDDKYTHYPPKKVKAIDSTAAGDSFIGAFVKKLIETNDKDYAMKYATCVSAIVVTRKGAQDSIPTEIEIENIIKENNWI